MIRWALESAKTAAAVMNTLSGKPSIKFRASFAFVTPHGLFLVFTGEDGGGGVEGGGGEGERRGAKGHERKQMCYG